MIFCYIEHPKMSLYFLCIYTFILKKIVIKQIKSSFHFTTNIFTRGMITYLSFMKNNKYKCNLILIIVNQALLPILFKLVLTRLLHTLQTINTTLGLHTVAACSRNNHPSSSPFSVAQKRPVRL